MTKFTKTAIFTIIRHTSYKFNELYSKGCREDPSKVTKNCENYEIYKNCEIYDNSLYYLQNQQNLFKELQGRPIESYENYEIYDNSPHHLQNQRNLFNGLQGRPFESYENCENYEIYENC